MQPVARLALQHARAHRPHNWPTAQTAQNGEGGGGEESGGGEGGEGGEGGGEAARWGPICAAANMCTRVSM